jgi:hypothetical protein
VTIQAAGEGENTKGAWRWIVIGERNLKGANEITIRIAATKQPVLIRPKIHRSQRGGFKSSAPANPADKRPSTSVASNSPDMRQQL